MSSNEKVESQVVYYTQKLGDLSRQLGFAGLALAWFFHSAASPNDQTIITAFAPELKLPLTLIVVSLALDAFQYILGSILWTLVYFNSPPGEEARNHPYIAGINLFVSIAKTLVMASAYYHLVKFILNSPLWN